MPAPEFHFGMTLAGDYGAPGKDDIAHVVVDVFRSVLAHAGVKGDAGDRLVNQVMAEYAKTQGGCTLRFTVRAGEIEIAFSKNGSDFRTSCPVPIK